MPAPVPAVVAVLLLVVSSCGAGPVSTTAASGENGAAAADGAETDRPSGRWVWPTGRRVVLRPWERPSSEYGPGHRGIDVVGAVGSPARAVDAGTVAFAGSVAGRGVVTVDHGGGLRSTLDSVEPAVGTGDAVEQGDVVGTVGVGHCTADDPCLHLGARLDGDYVDPLPYLSAAEWPVLLPER